MTIAVKAKAPPLGPGLRKLRWLRGGDLISNRRPRKLRWLREGDSI